MRDPAGPVVLVEREGPVAVVTLNRPERGNAINGALLVALRAALAELDDDAGVRAIVLTGAGGAFCTGMDLDDLDDLMSLPDLVPPAQSGPTGPWPPLMTPLVGAVNGAAVTGGLEVALACDVLIGSERARFADTHARVGIVPGWGLTVRLPLAVGIRAARAMSLTGGYVDAGAALRIGLLHEAVPTDELLPRAIRVARDIAENDPAALATYRAIYADLEAGLVGDGYRAEAAYMRGHLASSYRPGTARERRDEVIGRGRKEIRAT